MGWWSYAEADPPPRRRGSDTEELQALVLDASTTERMVQERKLLVFP